MFFILKVWRRVLFLRKQLHIRLDRRQAIIWINDGLLFKGHVGRNRSGIRLTTCVIKLIGKCPRNGDIFSRLQCVKDTMCHRTALQNGQFNCTLRNQGAQADHQPTTAIPLLIINRLILIERLPKGYIKCKYSHENDNIKISHTKNVYD